MRILFLTTAHNSLSQRLEIELTERGHEILGPGRGDRAKTFAAAHDGRWKAAVSMIAGSLASHRRQPTKLLTETICRTMLSPCCLPDSSPQFCKQFADSRSSCHETFFF